MSWQANAPARPKTAAAWGATRRCWKRWPTRNTKTTPICRSGSAPTSTRNTSASWKSMLRCTSSVALGGPIASRPPIRGNTSMSEYQYYEWQTIDRLLTEAEQTAVDKLSSHITVSASQAWVDYEYGDFKH